MTVSAPGIWILSTDHSADVGDIPDVAYFYVTIGSAGRLGQGRVAEAASILRHTLAAAKRSGQEAGVMPLLDGFDDDPRELFQIPLARRFIVQVMHEIGIRSLDDLRVRLFAQSALNLLMACGVFGPPPPVIIVPPGAAEV